MLGTSIMIVGRQVPTTYGTFIDLLGIDADGAVHILELKRNRTPRDVVAQALDYGSWVHNLSNEHIREVFTPSPRNHPQRGFRRALRWRRSPGRTQRGARTDGHRWRTGFRNRANRSLPQLQLWRADQCHVLSLLRRQRSLLSRSYMAHRRRGNARREQWTTPWRDESEVGVDASRDPLEAVGNVSQALDATRSTT
jgi:hypothetical protein